MNTVRIGLEPADQPEVVRLVEELDAHQRPLYPAESHHGIDISALSQPNVLFAVARDGHGDAIACGAVVLFENYGELKRMYVRPPHRGQRIGKAMLAFLEAQAAAKGCTSFALETGVRQPEAIGLYSAAGYVHCPPFGRYGPDPNSAFMRKNTG